MATQSPLLSLPTEIRHEIYRLVMETCETLRPSDIETSSFPVSYSSSVSHSVRYVSTMCRTDHDKVVDLYYKQNPVVVLYSPQGRTSSMIPDLRPEMLKICKAPTILDCILRKIFAYYHSQQQPVSAAPGPSNRMKFLTHKNTLYSELTTRLAAVYDSASGNPPHINRKNLEKFLTHIHYRQTRNPVITIKIELTGSTGSTNNTDRKSEQKINEIKSVIRDLHDLYNSEHAFMNIEFVGDKAAFQHWQEYIEFWFGKMDWRIEACTASS